MNKIRIGTRGSKLALKQAELVQAALQQLCGGQETEIAVIRTKGDIIQEKPLSEIGEKGVFASELERVLQDGEIDLAVHSAKDLPITLAEGLVIAAVLPRGDVRDVLVTPKGGRLPIPAENRLTDTKEPFVIGSGSRRRQQLAQGLWKNVMFENIRGNIDTRLQKLADAKEGGLEERQYHGIILAKAGLDRLDLISRRSDSFDFFPLSPERFLPAACQGIIAVETRCDSSAAAFCRRATDTETELCFLVEREVLSALSADCSEAIAAWCRREEKELTLDVMYAGKRGRFVSAAETDEGLKMARRAAAFVKEKERV